jgi:hypothetical protein
MKENETSGKDETLSKLLHTWKVEAQLPPRFQEAVWRRIENGDAELKISLWQTLRARIEAAFARPALAVAYVAVLLAAGVSVGYWRAEDRSAEVESELRSRYVQNIDPYQMPRQ